MVAFLNPELLITIFAARPDLESEISIIHFAKLRSQTFPDFQKTQPLLLKLATSHEDAWVIYNVLAIHSHPMFWKELQMVLVTSVKKNPKNKTKLRQLFRHHPPTHSCVSQCGSDPQILFR